MLSIGIDIGGTTIKGALFLNEQIIKEKRLPTHGRESLEMILSSLFGVIDALFDKSISYIGVSSAGNIDATNGRCVYASENLKGFTGLELRRLLEEKYRVKVYVDNDANCALYAELSKLDEVSKNQNIAMITLGTGVGVALYLNHQIYRGVNFDGGSYQHLCVNKNGYTCDCGKVGCAEIELSATGLKKKIVEAHIASLEALFKNEKENESYQKVLKEYFDKLQLFLDLIYEKKNISLFILGGGLVNSKETFKQYLKEKEYQIRYAYYEDKSGIIGGNLLDEYL